MSRSAKVLIVCTTIFALGTCAELAATLHSWGWF